MYKYVGQANSHPALCSALATFRTLRSSLETFSGAHCGQYAGAQYTRRRLPNQARAVPGSPNAPALNPSAARKSRRDFMEGPSFRDVLLMRFVRCDLEFKLGDLRCQG
jgi:hypothetical protein